MKTCIQKLCFALAWAALLALPTVLQAQFNFTTNNGAITITGYTGAGGDVTIPSSTNGYPVTSIGDYAFYGASLTNVIIPDSATSIGGFAFEFCSGLTSVTIPNSITTIGNGAFAYCSGLTSVTMGDSVTSILEGAFRLCYGLTNIAVNVANPSCASVGGVLFNKTLTTLVLYPAGLTGSYVIPDSVTSIGAYAFESCLGLTSVTLPDSVTTIGPGAFFECRNLTSVTIPNSVTNIGDFAFEYCYGLTSVTIPNSVTNIGNFALGNCISLTTVTIPNSVTTIGGAPFPDCTGLTHISVDAANAAYSSVDGVLFDKAQTTLIQFPGGRGGGYAIPNTVTNIAAYAFSGCYSLTNVTVGNSVTTIGQFAFSFCASLTKLTFLGNAPILGSAFGSVGSGAKVYYYYGTTGWGPTYGVLPTVMLGAPAPQVGAGSAGVKAGGFGFTLNGVVNQTIVVEASTNLQNWQPVWTNTLSSSFTNFADPQWLNFPSRFYRLRSP